ncbi:hypothetical protein KSC_092250 [Ktedonobacter sp. SOSP1-52]|nr:hypothetical protein KSC_092250 [Ktedonobacter sp. SOSP1-52]
MIGLSVERGVGVAGICTGAGDWQAATRMLIVAREQKWRLEYTGKEKGFALLECM